MQAYFTDADRARELAAEYAEGEDFEAYHLRSTLHEVYVRGVMSAQGKSAEQHYEGLLPAALRLQAQLMDEGVIGGDD
jgi:hypothetical protein